MNIFSIDNIAYEDFEYREFVCEECGKPTSKVVWLQSNDDMEGTTCYRCLVESYYEQFLEIDAQRRKQMSVAEAQLSSIIRRKTDGCIPCIRYRYILEFPEDIGLFLSRTTMHPDGKGPQFNCSDCLWKEHNADT